MTPDLPPHAYLLTDHVVLPRDQYEDLRNLWRRATDKLDQLRTIQQTPATTEHVRVLEWLLGVA